LLDSLLQETVRWRFETMETPEPPEQHGAPEQPLLQPDPSLKQPNDLEAQDDLEQANGIKHPNQSLKPNNTFESSKKDPKKSLQSLKFGNWIPSVLAVTAMAASTLVVVWFVLNPAENKVKGCAYRDLNGVIKDEPCARIEYPCKKYVNGERAECPASLLHFNCKSRRKEERQIMYCPYGPDGCTDPLDDCEPCCGSDGCGSSVPKCSEAFPKDTRNEEPTVKVKILMKASNRAPPAHDHQASTVHISFNGENCTLNNLPEMAASATRDLEWIVLDSFETLGDCSTLDVIEPLVQGRVRRSVQSVTVQMKLPSNSLVTISSVKLIDGKDDGRCWKSTWTGEKWNQQNNVYIEGSPVRFDQMC